MNPMGLGLHWPLSMIWIEMESQELLVGAPEDDDGGVDKGAAWIPVF